MKSKMEKELKKKNRVLHFGDLFKSFVSAPQEDLSEEEFIKNEASLTEDEKKELLAGMKSTENLAHSLFAERMAKAAKKIENNVTTKNSNTRVNSKTNTYNRKQREQGDRADY